MEKSTWYPLFAQCVKLALACCILCLPNYRPYGAVCCA